jgi:hypothetical protein
MSAKKKISQYFHTEACDSNEGEKVEDEDDGSSCDGDSSFINDDEEDNLLESTEQSFSDQYESESELSAISIKQEVVSVYTSSSESEVAAEHAFEKGLKKKNEKALKKRRRKGESNQ